MRDVTEHLLDLGHRNFAVVAPFARTNDRRRDRLRTIHDALAARGVSAADCLLVDDVGFGVQDGRRALARILEQAPRTTAVLCANDNIAAGVIIECRARGLRVPEDVSVTGYNDLEIAAAFDPAITTVGTPFEPVATGVVDYLLARMKGETPALPTILPTKLVVRASSGPCRDSASKTLRRRT